MARSKKKDFVKALSEFYEVSMDNIVKTINKLAEIQENFKDEYKTLKEIQFEPSKLEKYMANLTEQESGFLLRVFVKSAGFEQRFMQMFNSSVEEKRKLAKDVLEFKKYLEEKSKELEVLKNDK